MEKMCIFIRIIDTRQYGGVSMKIFSMFSKCLCVCVFVRASQIHCRFHSGVVQSEQYRQTDRQAGVFI